MIVYHSTVVLARTSKFNKFNLHGGCDGRILSRVVGNMDVRMSALPSTQHSIFLVQMKSCSFENVISSSTCKLCKIAQEHWQPLSLTRAFTKRRNLLPAILSIRSVYPLDDRTETSRLLTFDGGTLH